MTLPHNTLMMYAGGMPNVGSAERIADYLATLGITQAALARELNLERQTVNRWLQGFARPELKNAEAMVALAEKRSVAVTLGGHDITVEWILTGRGVANGTGNSNVVAYAGTKPRRQVPKLGNTESRLLPVRKRRSAERIAAHFECSERSYALEVVGRSMEEDFHAGDIVIIDPEVMPESGDFVHVELPDGSHVFRKYRTDRTVSKGVAPEYDLVPSNTDNWGAIHVSKSNPAKVLGVMIQRISPRRRR